MAHNMLNPPQDINFGSNIEFVDAGQSGVQTAWGASSRCDSCSGCGASGRCSSSGILS